VGKRGLTHSDSSLNTDEHRTSSHACYASRFLAYEQSTITEAAMLAVRWRLDSALTETSLFHHVQIFARDIDIKDAEVMKNEFQEKSACLPCTRYKVEQYS
jgi:hypothetical protein